MKRGLINKMENKKFTVVRVDKNEFELDNGDVYPHTFELDKDITIEEFQKIIDESQDLIVTHLKSINDSSNE